MNPQRQPRLFRRLETDTEFRTRLHTLKRLAWTMKHAVHQHGDGLDEFAWEHFRAQRRIVEVEA